MFCRAVLTGRRRRNLVQRTGDLTIAMDLGGPRNGAWMAQRSADGRGQSRGADLTEPEHSKRSINYFFGATVSIGPWRNRTAVTVPLASLWNSNVASTIL